MQYRLPFRHRKQKTLYFILFEFKIMYCGIHSHLIRHNDCFPVPTSLKTIPVYLSEDAITSINTRKNDTLYTLPREF